MSRIRTKRKEKIQDHPYHPNHHLLPVHQIGQCPVAWNLLRQCIAIVDVQDSDYPSHIHTRKGLIIRTNIPTSFGIASVELNVDVANKELSYTMTVIRSCYDTNYTIGKQLKAIPGFHKAMQEPLTSKWSAVKSSYERES